MRAVYLLIFSLAVGVCATGAVQAQPAQPSDAQILHLLNRISFGPAPGDIAAVRDMGIDAYIDRQLHPDRIAESRELQSRLEYLPTLNQSIEQLADQYSLPGEQEKALAPDQRKDYEKRRHVIVEELTQAKILRAIMSPAQLQEVMVDFWFNHFNVFAQKGPDKIFISSYDRDAIRPYAMKSFRELLQVTAHHPAMLVYLDNAQNTDPNSVAAQRAYQLGKQLGINENYAREVMELHTLGVDGGYTQQDVTTLAHILTGFGLSEGKGVEGHAAFYFEPKRHDFGDKIWLGHAIKGDGESEVEQVLDILAAEPATARHISYELAQYFVADQPPQSLVDKLTKVFLSSHGDIPAVLKALFHAPEFWDASYAQNKFKPPFRFIVSTFRAANVVPPGDTRMLQGALKQMGEPLYECLTPNGYANTNDQWLNSDALLKRIDFDQKLSGFLDAHAGQVVQSALGENWGANTLKTARDAPAKMQAALLLSSPEFVYY